MPAFDVATATNPVVQTIDEVFHAFAREVSDAVGEAAMPITCVRRDHAIMWTTVWFIDGKNNNLHVTLQGRCMVHVEIQSSQDPTTVKLFMRSAERLEEFLHRFTPDHWKAAN